MIETDASGFLQAANPHLPVVRGMIRGILRHDADAEDALQETLLQAFSNRHQLRVMECFRPWLVQIAINEARKLRRRQASQRVACSIDQTAGDLGSLPPREIPDPRENPSEMSERKQLHAFLRRKIDMLPETYRDVLILCDIENLSAAAAAKVLGVSKARVRTTIYRARTKLREDLAPLA